MKLVAQTSSLEEWTHSITLPCSHRCLLLWALHRTASFFPVLKWSLSGTSSFLLPSCSCRFLYRSVWHSTLRMIFRLRLPTLSLIFASSSTSSSPSLLLPWTQRQTSYRQIKEFWPGNTSNSGFGSTCLLSYLLMQSWNQVMPTFYLDLRKLVNFTSWSDCRVWQSYSNF